MPRNKRVQLLSQEASRNLRLRIKTPQFPASLDIRCSLLMIERKSPCTGECRRRLVCRQCPSISSLTARSPSCDGVYVPERGNGAIVQRGPGRRRHLLRLLHSEDRIRQGRNKLLVDPCSSFWFRKQTPPRSPFNASCLHAPRERLRVSGFCFLFRLSDTSFFLARVPFVPGSTVSFNHSAPPPPLSVLTHF